MNNNWRVILDPSQDAFTNMAIDEAIARSMAVPDSSTMPTLRIYSWRPTSISIGYFQRVSEVLSSLGPDISREGFDMVRRPTGGTAVIHDSGPSFSLVLKDERRTPSAKVTGLYLLLGRCVVEALGHLGISAELLQDARPSPPAADNSGLCALNPRPYDVIYKGMKIAGYAARRFRGVTLVQGYITLIDGLKVQELRDSIISALECTIGTKLRPGTLAREEGSLAARLREGKYTQREWNYKR